MVEEKDKKDKFKVRVRDDIDFSNFVEKLLTPSEESKDEHHRLRGEMVVSMVDIDTSLSHILKIHFMGLVDTDKSDHFIRYILRRGIKLMDKKIIVKKLGYFDRCPELNKTLDFLIEVRNVAAHSDYYSFGDSFYLLHENKRLKEAQTIYDLKELFDEKISFALSRLDGIIEVLEK